MKRYLRILLLAMITFLAFTIVNEVRASVTLISFEAVADSLNHKITLLWQTGSELDFAGFYIQRSLSPDSNFIRLRDADDNEIFFAAQGGGSGATYLYDDQDVVDGTLYYYMLEMVDLDGDLSFSDIISATLVNTPTPTLTFTVTSTGTSETRTPTLSRTPTPTRTNTHHFTATITRTPTRFRVVTYTSRPRATYTPTETPTITPTQTITPTVTTTLAPLPSLTLLFPVRTPTPTSTPTPTITMSPVPPTPTPTPKPDTHIPLRTSFLAGIIVLLWITLAGFLFAYLRKISQ